MNHRNTTAALIGPSAKSMYGYHKEKYQPIFEAIKRNIEQQYNTGIRTFITTGEAGFGQIAFWAICHVKEVHKDIKNVLYLSHDKSKFFYEDGLFGRREYELMKAHADEILIADVPYQGNNDTKFSYLCQATRNLSILEQAGVITVFCSHKEDIRKKVKSYGLLAVMSMTRPDTNVYLMDDVSFEIKQEKELYENFQMKTIKRKQ